MIRLFVGTDPREAVGLHVFLQSVLAHTSLPVAITPLTGMQGSGTNAFNLVRFMVPALCKFSGWAIWADGADCLLRADLEELWDLADSQYAVQVVKHDYQPKSDRKYIGTEMESPNEAYPMKNWSSVILWNCAHHANRALTKSFVRSQFGNYLHRFCWLADEFIGELPIEWNWLDEYGENEQAKLVHHTNGIPGFSHYANAPHAEEWKKALRESQRGLW
jgi:lipopolysaccharide biosynthesis glycosyltransferase